MKIILTLILAALLNGCAAIYTDKYINSMDDNKLAKEINAYKNASICIDKEEILNKLYAEKESRDKLAAATKAAKASHAKLLEEIAERAKQRKAEAETNRLFTETIKNASVPELLNQKENLHNLIRRYPETKNVRLAYAQYLNIPKDEMKHAENRTIQVGISERTLIAAWGVAKRINTTVTASGSNKQHVYENKYVYTKNGTVTSYQTTE